jgi:hypothetical protein
LRQQLVGAGAHAFQVGKIEFNEYEASVIGCGVLSHLLGCSFGLVQIPRRAYNLSAVRGRERAVSTPIPAETPVTRIPLPFRCPSDLRQTKRHLWSKLLQTKSRQAREVFSSFSTSLC